MCIEYEGSNIGPADGQIESYASRACKLSARGLQLRSQRAPLDPARPCVLRMERRYCVSGRFNCNEAARKPTTTTTLEGRISIFEETHSRKIERGERGMCRKEFRKVFLSRNDVCQLY